MSIYSTKIEEDTRSSTPTHRGASLKTGDQGTPRFHMDRFHSQLLADVLSLSEV